jgi:antirestriction protein ArdC
MKMTNTKIYEIVTDKILALLEQGITPWRQEWTTRMPQNFDSHRPYGGFNLLYLWLVQSLQGWEYPYYLTYQSAQRHEWHVKKGEKGNIVIFWKTYERTEKDEETGEEKTRQVRLLRYYYVFNLAQIEGWTRADLPREKEAVKIPTCEELIESFIPSLPEILKGAPAYSPSKDKIYLPGIEEFSAEEYYYSTRYHETIHATGAQHRLARPGIVDTINFGSDRYSFEELIAEIGAAFLSAMSGISTKTEQHEAAYIKSWSEQLRKEPTWIVKAASQAQKAVNFLLTPPTREG